MDELLKNCRLCPRECGVDRIKGEKGFCSGGKVPILARFGLHHGEEPCISGQRGSGTVFFSGCNLRCVFCQNHQISQQMKGSEYQLNELADVFLRLQERGAHNLNLVTAVHYVPQVLEALKRARGCGFRLPVIYNTSGYEKPDTLKMLEGWIDVYLPDLKYCSGALSLRYSSAADYFDRAAASIREMFRQVGPLELDAEGMAKRGLIIRHLLLPGAFDDSRRVISWIAQNLPRGVWVSLMSQYTPVHLAYRFPEINRLVAEPEYEQLLDHFLESGLENGFLQEPSSSGRRYIPRF